MIQLPIEKGSKHLRTAYVRSILTTRALRKHKEKNIQKKVCKVTSLKDIIFVCLAHICQELPRIFINQINLLFN